MGTETQISRQYGKMVAKHTLHQTTTRGMVLEQAADGVTRTIPLIDLVPPEAKGKRGTYRIVIEFEEDKS